MPSGRQEFGGGFEPIKVGELILKFNKWTSVEKLRHSFVKVVVEITSSRRVISTANFDK